MVSWITSFMTEAQAKTGVTPIIYTAHDWWDTCTGNSTAFGNDVLWVAAYSANTPGTLPAGWNTWNMWQYTSAGNVPGINTSVTTDLDYFSGAPQTMQTEVNAAASNVQVRTLSALTGDGETYTATGLPPGTSISSTGEISGTPTTTGAYRVTVTPSGAGTVFPTSVAFTWNVPGTITVTSPGSPSTTAGTAVDLQVAATDSASGYTPSFTATGLPTGLSITSGGKIIGWPDTPGTYSTTVTAKDSLGASASTSFTWTVGQAADSGATGAVVLQNGGKCLDDSKSLTSNGNRIDIWTCNGTGAQKWTVAADGTIRVLGKCLDTTSSGTANGTAIVLWQCDGNASQRWLAGTDAELYNPASNKCLDDPGANTTDGTKLDIWACNGGTNQHWTLPAGAVTSGIPGKCIDDNGSSSANGTKIDVYNCNGGGSQAWTIKTNGTVQVYGKCLDVVGQGTTVGTNIDLWACTGGSNQQWQLKVPAASGLGVELFNPHANLCAGDPSDSTANGTQLKLESCSASDPGVSWNVR
jgi:beta-glucosidase